ncbi:MAG: hypothetical protein ACRD3J_05205 [Thermoanaerobaculia bacterium]
MDDRDVYAAANPSVARASLEQPAGAGNGVLWIGMFLPPAAWATDLLVSIAAHHDYCAALVGHTFQPWSSISILLVLLGIVMLAACLGGGFAAWRAHTTVGSDDGRGNTDIDRRRFMARAGILSSALFSYGIVLRIIAPMIIPSAWCN